MRRRKCQSCRALIRPEVYELTRRMLGALDGRRRRVLKDAFGGKAPRQLCAPCFNATVGTLNNIVVRQAREAA